MRISGGYYRHWWNVTTFTHELFPTTSTLFQDFHFHLLYTSTLSDCMLLSSAFQNWFKNHLNCIGSWRKRKYIDDIHDIHDGQGEKLRCLVFPDAIHINIGNPTNCSNFTASLSISNWKDDGQWQSRATSDHYSRYGKNIWYLIGLHWTTTNVSVQLLPC